MAWGQGLRRCKRVQQRPRRNKKESVYNAINEIKTTLEGTNSRLTEAEDRISEVEDRMVEINETEEKRKTN